MIDYDDSKYVKLATVVEDDQKAPFSIATTPRCRGRALQTDQQISAKPIN